LLNISVTLMPDRVDVEAPNRRPRVVVVVFVLSLARLYPPLEGSRLSLLSRPTALRPEDTEIPESSDRELWRVYDDEVVVLWTRTHFDEIRYGKLSQTAIGHFRFSSTPQTSHRLTFDIPPCCWTIPICPSYLSITKHNLCKATNGLLQKHMWLSPH
jgi:hypothetical protein